MNPELTSLFTDALNDVEIRDGIPRFTPDFSYSSGNFSRLREEHATLQLDSKNGTTDRCETILERTGWPQEFFKGKTVLECGCGAGPDTEVLLSLGAKVVAFDLAGLDVAKRNLGENPNLVLAQGDITNLPLKPQSFDIVFCHRVLQHTPNPVQTLEHILSFVKPEGAVFVHSYARNFYQMFRWKYALLPLTRLVPPEKLYNFIKGYAPFAYWLTSLIQKLPKGGYINYAFIPFYNFRALPRLQHLSDEEIIERGVHDTFDALSPKYDKPLSAKRMKYIAQKSLQQPFEVICEPQITLLRSVFR